MPSHDDAAASPEPFDFDAWLRDNYAALVASLTWVRLRGLDPGDVAHEALLVVNRRLRQGGIRSRVSLLAYAKVVAANIVKTEFGPDGPGWHRHETPVPVPSAALAVALDALDPEAVFLTDESYSETLTRIFDSLPKTQRAALLLAADGHSPAEIAATLDLPTARAAIQLLYRARENAKAAYAAEEADDSESAPLPLFLAAHAAARRIAQMPTTALAEPAAACVALAAAFSIVAALGAAAPRAAASAESVQAAPGGAVVGDHRERPPFAWTAARRGQGGDAQEAESRATGATSPAATPDAAAPTLDVRVGTCVPVACVAYRPPPGPTWIGDRYTVPALGDGSPQVYQRATPTCGYVPAQPVVECESGKDPDGYEVKEVPPVPASAGADPGGIAP